MEEELKEGINKQFNHKYQVESKEQEPNPFVYDTNTANIVFGQLSPPPENSSSINTQPITIIQQPNILALDPMTPPSSNERISPSSSPLTSPIEIKVQQPITMISQPQPTTFVMQNNVLVPTTTEAFIQTPNDNNQKPSNYTTTIFQQPNITSPYIEPEIDEHRDQEINGNTPPSVTQQPTQQTINVSYVSQAQIVNKPTSSIQTTSCSQTTLLSNSSDVVSSTKWSTTDHLSSSSGLSPLPSSPSAQLSPSPPHSPNSNPESSGGSPRLFIAESKSTSPSIPSSQVSPSSDVEPIYSEKPQYYTIKKENGENTKTFASESVPVSQHLKIDPKREGPSGHKVVIQLQNHQLQQLKNQLNMFVVSNSILNGVSSSSTLPISTTNEATTFKGQNVCKMTKMGKTSIASSSANTQKTSTITNKCRKVVNYHHILPKTSINPGNGKVFSDSILKGEREQYGFSSSYNNVNLKIEDEVYDEIIPHQPSPQCYPISMPLNVQVKSEMYDGTNDFSKLRFPTMNKPQILNNTQLLQLHPSAKAQSSSMSTASPSIVHRLGKRPSSFNHCLLHPSSISKAQKIHTSDEREMTNSPPNMNVITLNGIDSITRGNNTSAGQSAITTAFVTTTSNINKDRTKQAEQNLFQIVKPELLSKSIPSHINTSSYSTSGSRKRNNQVVVLRSSLPPKVMRKVIGISPPRGPAGLSTSLIPSVATPPSNAMADNLVCMM